MELLKQLKNRPEVETHLVMTKGAELTLRAECGLEPEALGAMATAWHAVDAIGALPVTSLFNPRDLPGYTTSDAAACPLCRAGQKLDAIVNSFGYSKLH